MEVHEQASRRWLRSDRGSCALGEDMVSQFSVTHQCGDCGATWAPGHEPLCHQVGPDEGLRAINAEIARRESPEYQRFAKPSENQTPANRAGQAAARAQQHGELVGLKLARAALEGSAE